MDDSEFAIQSRVVGGQSPGLTRTPRFRASSAISSPPIVPLPIKPPFLVGHTTLSHRRKQESGLINCPLSSPLDTFVRTELPPTFILRWCSTRFPLHSPLPPLLPDH